jgi:hypothetical protein
MKTIPLHEAARQLGVHPLNLLLRVQKYVGSLEDCWPNVADGYLETLKAMRNDRRGEHIASTPVQVTKSSPAPSTTRRVVALSAGASRVIEKLWRKDRWGDMSVSLPSIQKMCQDVSDVEDAVEELVRLGLVNAGESKRGPFSLVSARKADIEAIAREIIK